MKQQLAASSFMEVTIVLTWSIWTTRNSLIFNVIQPSTQIMKAAFTYEFAVVIHRAKQKYFPEIKI